MSAVATSVPTATNRTVRNIILGFRLPHPLLLVGIVLAAVFLLRMVQCDNVKFPE